MHRRAAAIVDRRRVAALVHQGRQLDEVELLDGDVHVQRGAAEEGAQLARRRLPRHDAVEVLRREVDAVRHLKGQRRWRLSTGEWLEYPLEYPRQWLGTRWLSLALGVTGCLEPPGST